MDSIDEDHHDILSTFQDLLRSGVRGSSPTNVCRPQDQDPNRSADWCEKTTFDVAIYDLVSITGVAYLFVGEALAHYVKPYDVYEDNESRRRIPSAAVTLGSSDELWQVVKIANKLAIPLWTFSRGKNLGYAVPAPVVHGSIALDLHRMNRILEVNDELHYAVVEPGVTWTDLYNYCVENRKKVLRSTPSLGWGSVIGNTVDRGTGFGSNSNHWAESIASSRWAPQRPKCTSFADATAKRPVDLIKVNSEPMESISGEGETTLVGRECGEADGEDDDDVLYNLWGIACARLREEEPELMDAYANDLLAADRKQPPTTEQQVAADETTSTEGYRHERKLQEFTLRKLDALADARWKITIGGKEVVVRDQIANATRKLLSNPATQWEDTADGLKYIADILIRSRVIEVNCGYDRYWDDSSKFSLSTPMGELHKQIKTKLVDLYCGILRYQIRLASLQQHILFWDRVYVDSIYKAKHGSDSGTFDAEGRFVPQAFEDMFSKYDRDHDGALTFRELFDMMHGNRCAADPFGWRAAFFEWVTTWLLIQKDGKIYKDDLQGVYDGSLFWKIKEARKSGEGWSQGFGLGGDGFVGGTKVA
ncbi:Caleosin related protein-domain-containing protein [Aspergillus insuetus]